MSTLSTSMLNSLASQWEDSYGSAVLSGIVGDLAHKARGGYHISREDQSSTNYSVIRADDKPGMGPSDRAAAIDMTMSTADIIKCHTQLRNFWKNRANDPRMQYINAWNGWDGTGDAGRYDVVKGTVETASSDHKWHIHLEVRRRYVNDTTAQKAILSMLKGESVNSYLGKSPTGDDDEMTEAELLAGLTKWAKSNDGKAAIASAVGATDDVFNTPELYLYNGQPTYQSNPFLTLKDLLKQLANHVVNTENTVAQLQKDIAALKGGGTTPPPTA